MEPRHPKAIRRQLLTLLYDRYMNDPLEMIEPPFFLRDHAMSREDLIPNIHYLADRNLVELMTGYNPPLFAGARLKADGIDLVENRYEFNRRFPPELEGMEEEMADLPVLVEKLVYEIDMSPMEGEIRECLLRDVAYLREEIARPAHLWRSHVLQTVLDWIESAAEEPARDVPSAARLRERIVEKLED
ncbi:MAG: hypothetical protein IT368_10415 [Candidatus Hydrogenedentes bacterium]|nr:hypothetical protein [Candidatus Hydrogenedentota bacterium]